MAKTKPPEFWAKVQADFEAGTSKAELSRIYDVTTNAITYRQKKEGWEVKPDEPEVDDVAETSTVEAEVEWDDPVEGPPADIEQARLLARVAELEAQLAEREAEAARLSPTATVDLPSTAEEVLDFYGGDVIDEILELRLAAENIDRFRKGLPQLDFASNPEVFQRQKAEYARKLASARTRPPQAIAKQRVVKMRRPDGVIVQWPVETQIHNEAGQAGASLWKAREKGLQAVEPWICQALDCWLKAATNEHGELSLDGYCSPEHRMLDPYLSGNPVANVTTSRMVGL